MNKPKGQQSGQINFQAASICSQPGNPLYYYPGSLTPGTLTKPDRQGKQYIAQPNGSLVRSR